MGEWGDRLWVGEPGRLSPDDKEWFRDEKLRLVCRRGEGCIAKRLNRERLLGGGKSTVRKGGKSLKSFSLKSVGYHNKNKKGRDLNMLLFELNLFLFTPCFPQNTNKPLRLIRVEEKRGANVQSLQEYKE